MRSYIIPIIVIASLVFCTQASADVKLRPDHPAQYTVRKGDSLWKIAGRFLSNPWQWPKIWHVNPSIQNPNLIYPGDVLVFSMYKNQPEVTLVPLQHPLETVVLSPTIRSTPIKPEPIPGFNVNSIYPFLSYSLLMSSNLLNDAPKVVQVEGHHLVGSPDTVIYVKGLTATAGQVLALYRVSRRLKDPVDGSYLGVEAVWLGDAKVIVPGNPAKVRILYSVKEVDPGDRLVPPPAMPAPVFPYLPHAPVNARVVAMGHGIGEAATNSVVILNRGVEDGLENGAVLEVKNMAVSGGRNENAKVDGPPRHSHTVLYIFHAFAHLSYAVVIQANRPVKIGAEASVPAA
ncbi:MAG TPA: LysM peptidoglycan-binding domain-containing protein [Burkholderiales bacterium]|nr:LysM peptidoglycan-binding domain-containing protein [Burkholderiales bacterium]